MPIPGENSVIRLKESRASLAHMNVLDVAVAGAADTVALVEWAYGSAVLDVAGFSLLRTSPRLHSDLFPPNWTVWNRSYVLCSADESDCGRFVIERASLARTPDGFIVAGTAINADDNKPTMFAMRVNDAGGVMWVKRYVAKAEPPETLKPGHIVAITPMGAPDRYLVAANAELGDAWLFQIDGNGNVTRSARWFGLEVRQLRTTATQILMVGAANVDTGAVALVQSLDLKTGDAAWKRAYHDTVHGPYFGWRWYDIAEAEKVLLVIGQHVAMTSEKRTMMAFLDKTNGDLYSHLEPILSDGAPVRLRSVISRNDEGVPLTAGAVPSSFVVAGEAANKPWYFRIGEDQAVHWQKSLRTPTGEKGTFRALAWPSYDDIAAGGSIADINTPRGLVSWTSATIGRGKMNCSDQTRLTFGEPPLEAMRVGFSFDAVTITAERMQHRDGPLINFDRKCLRDQTESG